MSNPGPALTIGAVAALAGKRPSSIRYYEQIGLLPPAARVSGRRVYGPDAVRTLAVIETGQRAGLTLDEIKALLSASPDDQAAIDTFWRPGRSAWGQVRWRSSAASSSGRRWLATR